jgi:hypothetical protein
MIFWVADEPMRFRQWSSRTPCAILDKKTFQRPLRVIHIGSAMPEPFPLYHA